MKRLKPLIDLSSETNIVYYFHQHLYVPNEQGSISGETHQNDIPEPLFEIQKNVVYDKINFSMVCYNTQYIIIYSMVCSFQTDSYNDQPPKCAMILKVTRLTSQHFLRIHRICLVQTWTRQYLDSLDRDRCLTIWVWFIHKQNITQSYHFILCAKLMIPNFLSTCPKPTLEHCLEGISE